MKISQLLIGLCALSAVSAIAQDRGNEWDRSNFRHVLLISVDGMHAVDYLNCSKGRTARILQHWASEASTTWQPARRALQTPSLV